MRVRPLALALTTAVTLVVALVTTTAPAQAATADGWGFAYVDNPTVAVWTDLDHAHQYGSWKPAFPALWAQGIKVALGRFQVRFPQVGAGRGNVHVTAVNRTGDYCLIVRWGQSLTDEIVDVQCRKPGGAAVDSRFTVLWTSSSGVLPSPLTSYASVQQGLGGPVQSYNSTGGPVTVAAGPVGQYQVRFAGVGGAATSVSGNVQVTAIQPNAIARRCKVARFFNSGPDIIVYVFCFDAAGAPVAGEFTASYHRERSVIASFAPPKFFGYLWTAGGGLTNFNYPAGGFGFNSFAAIAPPGRYQVKYPLLGQQETHAQVTAFGDSSDYCHLTDLWVHSGGTALVDVLCFDNAGVTRANPFLSTFTSSI
jgi:hypothetical protein